MKSILPKRLRRALCVFLSALAAAGAGCRRAELPEKGSPKYLSAVRAFYVGLSALQVGDGLIWVSGGGTQIGGSFGSLFNQVYRPAVSCE